MTDKEKKVVFTLIAIMVIVLIVVIIVKQVGGGNDNTNTDTMNGTTNNTANEEQYVTELNDGTKLNTSEDLQNVKTYKDLEISNPQVTSNGSNTVIIAQVKNNGTTNFEPEIVKLTLLGENDEVIDEIYPVMPNVSAGGTAQLEATFSGADVANFRDFTITADDR